MLAPVRTEKPAAAPVDLDQVKLHLLVDHGDDDDLIEAFIDAAVEHLDGYAGILGRALVTQTWVQKFPRFFGAMRLALAPVAEVVSVEYFDENNSEADLGSGPFEVQVDAMGPFLVPPSQPATYPRMDAVTVTYKAGQPADDVPAPIKTAMLLLIANWYANREAVSDVASTALPFGVSALLAPYRRVGI